MYGLILVVKSLLQLKMLDYNSMFNFYSKEKIASQLNLEIWAGWVDGDPFDFRVRLRLKN